MRLEGIGFGFLIPIYFVVTGMTFDLDSLLTRRRPALAALFLGLLLVVRGASALLWLRELGRAADGGPGPLRRDGPAADRRHRRHRHRPRRDRRRVGASLIGAGMLSVLVFPLAAIGIVGRRAATSRSAPDDEEYRRSPRRPELGAQVERIRWASPRSRRSRARCR